LAGIGLTVAAFTSSLAVQGYKESVTAKVTRRTPDLVVVEFKAPISGGSGHYEMPYSSISGSKPKAPPNAGEMKLGEKVELVYPLGKPGAARLPNSLVPLIPEWIGWLGAFWIVMAGVILFLYRVPADLPELVS